VIEFLDNNYDFENWADHNAFWFILGNSFHRLNEIVLDNRDSTQFFYKLWTLLQRRRVPKCLSNLKLILHTLLYSNRIINRESATVELNFHRMIISFLGRRMKFICLIQSIIVIYINNCDCGDSRHIHKKMQSVSNEIYEFVLLRRVSFNMCFVRTFSLTAQERERPFVSLIC
jgi:hypothetical protein